MARRIKPCDPSRTRLQHWMVGLIRESGVSQAELAKRVGITEKHLSQMLTGTTEGSLFMWQALLDAVGVEI